MLGVIIESNNQDNNSFNYKDLGAIIMAPILLPVLAGIMVTEKLK